MHALYYKKWYLMPKTKEVINIQNVVSAATLKQKVDLNAVIKSFPGVEYRPERFPGLVFKLKRPKTATLIFNSGKMVCTGAKSEKESRKAVMTVVKELKKSGIIIISKPDLKVVNIVASASLGGMVDLEKSAYVLGHVMYEPEQFPGLIYRMDDPKVVILLLSAQERRKNRTFMMQCISFTQTWRNKTSYSTNKSFTPIPKIYSLASSNPLSDSN
jgi:transcription initiation factor TFIID TATA-box-binding protein